jgi:HK97 family phage major capsid protein
MSVDIYRGTSGVLLPPAVSQDIWQLTQEASGVMGAAQQIPLPGRGVSIPIITGDPSADWVGETAKKPVSRPALSNKTITPYTLAVITPFSNQFRRDLPGLYTALVQRLPGVLAKKFDTTVFGLAAGAPGSNFDTLGAATAVGIAGNTWKGVTTAVSTVATATVDGELEAWVLSPQGKSVFLGAIDTVGRPLYLDSTTGGGGIPQIAGAPVYTSRASYVLDADGAGGGTDKQYGYAGDWDNAFWGSVEGIQISISDQATLLDSDGTTSINLWQQNMFAVRAEIEVGFRVRDLAYFVKLTSATQS